MALECKKNKNKNTTLCECTENGRLMNAPIKAARFSRRLPVSNFLSTADMDQLPNSVLFHIFSFCHWQFSFCTAERVCRRWQTLIRDMPFYKMPTPLNRYVLLVVEICWNARGVFAERSRRPSTNGFFFTDAVTIITYEFESHRFDLGLFCQLLRRVPAASLELMVWNFPDGLTDLLMTFGKRFFRMAKFDGSLGADVVCFFRLFPNAVSFNIRGDRFAFPPMNGAFLNSVTSLTLTHRISCVNDLIDLLAGFPQLMQLTLLSTILSANIGENLVESHTRFWVYLYNKPHFVLLTRDVHFVPLRPLHKFEHFMNGHIGFSDVLHFENGVKHVKAR